MIKIYYFDSNGYSYGENDLLPPNDQGFYDIPSNATDIQPKNGLYTPIKFDGEKWIGTPKEKWEKENLVEDNLIEPPNLNLYGTDEELRNMFANMQVQLVQANTIVMQLSQQNAQLTQELVKLNQKIEKLKGENKNEDVIPKV